MSIDESIDTILEKDPAARSRLEVVLCYPGFHAITLHRLANRLWREEWYTLARFVSHVSRVITGIEIHPGASIGKRFFIDHGMGVVIGETTVIGDDVVLYQGVTLGAGAAARQGALTRGKKRHPTLGNGVIVGSGAEIQGDIVVGDNVRVASGSIVLKDVPANSVVVGVPGRVIYRDGRKVPQEETPDPEAEAIKCLQGHIKSLEAQMESMKAAIKRVAKETREAQKADSEADEPQDEVQPPSDGTDPVDVFLQGAGI